MWIMFSLSLLLTSDDDEVMKKKEETFLKLPTLKEFCFQIKVELTNIAKWQAEF